MGYKQGRTTAVGIGFESTPGTAVAASIVAKLVSYSVTPTVTTEDIDDLMLGSTGFRQANFEATSRVAFELVFHAYYEGGALTTILRSLIGGTWNTTGSGPYAHELTPGTTPPAMTYRIDRDYDVSTGARTGGGILAGAYCGSATIEVPLNGLMRITVRGVALSWTTGSTPSLTIPAHDEPVRSADADNWTWNSADYTPRNVTIEINNGLLEVDAQGSVSSSAVVVNDPRTVQATITRYKDGDAWVDAHIARTESTADITYAESGGDSFKIDLGASIIRQAIAHEATTVGLLEETGVFVARDDGTNAPIKFTVTNDDSTAEAS